MYNILSQPWNSNHFLLPPMSKIQLNGATVVAKAVKVEQQDRPRDWSASNSRGYRGLKHVNAHFQTVFLLF